MTESSQMASSPAVVGELHTFLFADVRGYTRFTQEHGDEAAAQLVAKFAAITRETVHERGGDVIELRGDEALAVFSSARQALRAAIDLQARYSEATEMDPQLPLAVGIGIDAGEAVRFEGGYRGDALNLAARLCNLAGPGEVLTSEGVVYLSRNVPGVTYAERGLVPIKGFSDPVRVVRVYAENPSPVAPSSPSSGGVDTGVGEASLPIGAFLGALPSGTLVGREAEWAEIVESLEAVMGGTGRLVLLSGEPGIGKTRLAQEVTLKARHWGFVVATGRCYEQERSVPYYPFIEALTTLYDASSPSLRAEVPRRWPQLGRLLPDQMGLIPIALSPGAPGQDDQHLMFRAVTGFMEALAATAPVALLLDDLHWADDATLKLLLHLVRYTRAHRVFLLGTYRDVEIHRHHPLETALLELGRERLLTEIEVRRLGAHATAALMAEIIGSADDLGDLPDLIYRRTDGNAFFVHETMRALVERGDLYKENGRWQRREVQEMEVPKSIRSVIGQRLSRLEEGAQEILREASVFGQTFTFDDLLTFSALAPSTRAAGDAARAREWTEDEIEGALEQGILSGLIREVGSDTYAFNHALTQGTLYAELSTRRRKRLHLAAGRALDRLPERERRRRAGELAWHFLEGDDVAQALRYSMIAGDRAAEVFANGEAERHYRMALELARELGDEAREVEALERLGGMLATGARYEQALGVFEQAVELRRAMGDRDGEAYDVAQIGQVHYYMDTAEEGIARLKPMLEALERESTEEPTIRGRAWLWTSLARLYVDLGQNEEQLAAAERAVELARRLGDDRLLLSAEVTRSDALWRLHRDDEALHEMEALIPRAEAIDDLHNLARALGNTASLYASRGELDKDRQYRERSLEVARRRGDQGQILLAHMSLSTNAFLVGDWQSASAQLEEAEEIVHSLGTTRLALWPVVARGWLELARGDLRAARGAAESALALIDGASDLIWRRNVERILTEVDLLEGNVHAGAERLERLREQPGWKKDVGFLCTLAHTNVALGKLDDARQIASMAVQRAVDQMRPSDLVEALVTQGAVAVEEGSWDVAASVLRSAVERAHTMSFLYGEARALYQMGRVQTGLGDGGAARDSFQRARAFFQQLGARREMQEAERQLQTLAAGATSC